MELQEGTIPLVKKLRGKYTRTFVNWRYPKVSKNDVGGSRTMIGNRYKLVMDQETEVELFDLLEDRAESNNLINSKPDIAEKMQKQLYDWQQSVLQSLSGADYK